MSFFLVKKYCYPRLTEIDCWETRCTFWTNMKLRLVCALYKKKISEIRFFLLWKKSTAAIKTDQAGKPVPFIMLLNIWRNSWYWFFSAPVAKPLACCVHIIRRPPSEIFFSYILRLQDFDTAFKLEKICMTKVVVWKKKRKKEKEKYHQFVICWIFPGSNKGYFFDTQINCAHAQGNFR